MPKTFLHYADNIHTMHFPIYSSLYASIPLGKAEVSNHLLCFLTITAITFSPGYLVVIFISYFYISLTIPSPTSTICNITFSRSSKASSPSQSHCAKGILCLILFSNAIHTQQTPKASCTQRKKYHA